ncbi:MAG: type VI secretion system-associated FHA domain protein TagH [Pseudomonadota bacterium]
MTLTLRIEGSGAVPGGTDRITMMGEALTIGRAPGNDLVLPDPERVISSRHCVLEARGGDYLLIDISTNGTFVNYAAEAVGPAPIPINNGDVIGVGRYELRVEIAQAAAARDPYADLPPPVEVAPLVQPGRGQQDIFGPGGEIAPPGGSEADFLDDLLGDAPAGHARRTAHDPGPRPEDLLPPDIVGDPLAPDAHEPVPGASIANHGPGMQDHFAPPQVQRGAGMAPPAPMPPSQTPPAPMPPAAPPPEGQFGAPFGGNLLPDDWDDDLGPGSPDLSPPPPQSPPQYSPPQQHRPSAPPPGRAAPGQAPDPFSAPAGPPNDPFAEPPSAPPPSASPPSASPPSAPTGVPDAMPPAEHRGIPPGPFADPASAAISGAPHLPPSSTPPPAPAAPPQPAAPQPAAPPQPAAQATPPATAPTATAPTADMAAARAFLRAAGMDETAVPDTELEEVMSRLGETFHILVGGLREVLISRAAIKNEFRLTQTVISIDGNNPLKFSVSAEHAVESMVKPATPGYQPAPVAAREAIDDIKAHEVAMMTGMQAAIDALLKRFDPEKLSGRIERSGLSSLLSNRKARLWDNFEVLYGDIAREAEDDFQALFGREFARAYQAQLKKL